ncbi:TetR family transcriptional regulator [Actinoplanes bogorensis]|uniref:TetR family transcriptional regulator n=1 Tax=Paractinoplanes bogorensis TaxID=1610840 RepID=A0ABS5YJG0_9ACTN|nr:TetR family transcriptional regulator [Actinoplanes bogorensis]MBU2662085.1 TetR family transcriptional regulator [Actinoplanes bogorensis]
MRPSKRTLILEAALRVIGRDGVAGVTYESVAEEAGLTKAGLVYHFATREDLLHGVHAHIAGQWEASMTSLAGAPADQLSDLERLDAYIRTTTQSVTRAELLLLLDTAGDVTVSAPVTGVLNRWAPPPPGNPPLSDRQLTMLLAQLAADGLWLHEALTGTSIAPQTLQYLTEQIAELAGRYPEPS